MTSESPTTDHVRENLLSTQTRSYSFDSTTMSTDSKSFTGSTESPKSLMGGFSISVGSEYSSTTRSGSQDSSGVTNLELSSGDFSFSDSASFTSANSASAASSVSSEVSGLSESSPTATDLDLYSDSDHHSSVSIITTLSMPNATTSAVNYANIVNATTTRHTSTLTLTRIFTSRKSTVYSTEYSTVIISTEQPLTTFGYVYTQPYVITKGDSSSSTEIPTTVTATTRGISISLSHYSTMTVSPQYFSQNVLHEKQRSNTGAIAGGVVGSVAGLALFLLLIWFFRKKYLKNKTTSEKPGEVASDSNSSENPFGESEKKIIPDHKPFRLSSFSAASKLFSKRSNDAVSAATNSIRSTSSTGSDNGLFAMRDNLLQGSSPSVPTTELKTQPFTSYPRNRVIDTVYEESSESLSSRRSSQASNKYHKKTRSSPAIFESGSEEEVKKEKKRVPPARPVSSKPVFTYNRGSERYANSGLRKYYIENPFDDDNRSIDSDSDSVNDFEEMTERNNYGYIDRG